MQVHVVSDLHRDYLLDKHGLEKPEATEAIERLAAVESDVVVCAGDMDIKGRAVETVARIANGRTAVLVPGNHEYYASVYSHARKKLRERAAKYENVHVLDNGVLDLGDVVFVGSTLWTDMKAFESGLLAGRYSYRDVLAQCELKSTDFQRIKVGTRKMTTKDTERFHSIAKSYLRNTVSELQGRKVVVVTHHAPSLKSSHEIYSGDVTQACYISHLDEFVQELNPAMWVHGHVHETLDYMLGDTRVVANCYGYDPELYDMFKYDFVVEV